MSLLKMKSKYGVGDFLYLTNFENYDPTTGLDNPIIGEQRKWWRTDSYCCVDADSKIIGKSKYGVFLNSCTNDNDVSYLCDWSKSNTYSIDFIIKQFYISSNSPRSSGVRLWIKEDSIPQTRTATAFYVDSYPGYCKIGACAPKYNPIYIKDGNKTTTPNNWDTYPIMTSFNAAYYAWLSTAGNEMTKEYHVAIVLNNEERQYKFYIDGILYTVANSDILRFVRLYLSTTLRHGYAISNFAVRIGDLSIGEGTDSVFPVPKKSYGEMVWTDPKTNIELFTDFRNYNSENGEDTPVIGNPYFVSQPSAVQLLAPMQFYSTYNRGVKFTSSVGGIKFNFADGKPRSIEINYARILDGNCNYPWFAVRRNSDSAYFVMHNYHYYDYVHSLVVDTSCTIYHGSYNLIRGNGTRLLNNSTSSVNSLYGINDYEFASAVLDPVNNIATLYINGIRAMSMECTDWEGDFELMFSGGAYVTDIAVIAEDKSNPMNKDVYMIPPTPYVQPQLDD